MKLIVLSFMTAALWFPTFAQQKKSDRERDGLIGPVHLVAESRLKTMASVGEAGFVTRRTYNREGNLLEISAPSFGLSRTIETFERLGDGAGRMHRRSVGVSDMGPVSLIYNPPGDKYGAELYTVRYSHDSRYKRAAAGVTLDSTSIHESLIAADKIVRRKLYVFDPQSRLTQEIEVWSHDLVVRQTFYKYESPSVKAPQYMELRVDGVQKYEVWFEYEFDDRGNWIKRTKVKEDPFIPSSPPNLVTYRTITYYP